jgi:hypothetical protein
LPLSLLNLRLKVGGGLAEAGATASANDATATSADGAAHVSADHEGDIAASEGGAAGLNAPSMQRELIPFEAATSIEKVCCGCRCCSPH